jgi:Family of unknown function (DUF6655)
VASAMRVAAVAMAAVLAGCTTTRLAEPQRTSTEELLVSAAVDRAVAKLSPALPAHARVFVDTRFFDTEPADLMFPKYTIGAVRDRLARAGARLVDDKKGADVVVELRTGGESIDHNTFLVGIPTFKIPIPLTSSALTMPELALYKRDRQTGVAKLAITAYRRETGALEASSGPEYGASDHTRFAALLFFKWVASDIEPDALKPRTQ